MIGPTALAALGAAAVGLPILLVRQHVRALLYFVSEGERTKAPEELSAMERLQVLMTGARIPRPVSERTPAEFELPFETSTVSTADGHHLEVWTVVGGPRIVVLFHGYTASKDQVLDAVPWFRGQGYTVHLVDFRASGGSTGNYTTLGAEEAADVDAVLRWARVPGEPLVAYGFSMGGAALLRALGESSLDVDAVVVDGVFDRLSTTLGHRFRTMGLPASPGRELLLAWGSVELRRNAWRVAPVEDAAKVRAPVLVLCGTADPRVHVQEARAITAALPNGRLHLLSGGDHRPGFESTPLEWDGALTRFLQDVLETRE